MPRLYAATGDSIARATARADGSWSVDVALEGTAVQCVAVDPNDPAHVVAGSRGQGLFASRDGGDTWTEGELPHPDVFSVAVGVDGTVYAGCEPSMLFRSENGEWRELDALRRLPSAPTWRFPPRPWTSHVRWIAPSPHDARLLLVGIELGGLMRSEDGGETWHDHAPGAQRDVHSLAWHPTAAERAYEAGGGGAAWSRDAGRTWDAADAGRDRHYTWAVAVDPLDPDTWFVSASTGPRAAHRGHAAEARLYRWRRDGPWEHVGDPLDSMPYALVFGGDRLFAGLADGTILASADRGDSWEALTLTGTPPRAVHALAYAP